MGSYMAKAMDESFQKNKEFMTEMQENTVKRQLQMQNQMRERMMAMQLAGSRDVFTWFASFYGVAAVAGIARAMKGNKIGLVPLLPLTFMLGYQYDYCYHTKVERIRTEAERIIREEHSLLGLPNGLPTFEAIEAARLAATVAAERKED